MKSLLVILLVIMIFYYNYFQAILMSMCLQGMVDELIMKKQGKRLKRVRISVINTLNFD